MIIHPHPQLLHPPLRHSPLHIMLKSSIIASLLAALSAAELHIYDVRDTAYTPDTDYEWTGILEFNGPPDCNDARGR